MAASTQTELPPTVGPSTTMPIKPEVVAAKSSWTLDTITVDCLLLVVDALPCCDIIAFRSTCRKMRDAADRTFLSVYFRHRKQLCTPDGLETLLDIMKMPRLREATRFLTFLAISPDVYSTLARNYSVRQEFKIRAQLCSCNRLGRKRPELPGQKAPVIHIGEVMERAYQLGEENSTRLIGGPGVTNTLSRLAELLSEASHPLELSFDICTQIWTFPYRCSCHRSDAHSIRHHDFSGPHGISKLRQDIDNIYNQVSPSTEACKAFHGFEAWAFGDLYEGSSRNKQLRGDVLSRVMTGLFGQSSRLSISSMSIKYALPKLLPQNSTPQLSLALANLKKVNLSCFHFCNVDHRNADVTQPHWLRAWFASLHSIEDLSLTGYNRHIDAEVSEAITSCLNTKSLHKVSLSTLSLPQSQWHAIIDKLGSSLRDLTLVDCGVINFQIYEEFVWPFVLRRLLLQTSIERLDVNGLGENDGDESGELEPCEDTLWLDMEQIESSPELADVDGGSQPADQDASLSQDEHAVGSDQDEHVEEEEEWVDRNEYYESDRHIVWGSRSESTLR